MSAPTPTPAALTPEESDPVAMGWMTGFPPPPDKAILFADGSFREFPQSRWSHSNFRQFVPTRAVWRGPGLASPLPRAEQDLAGVPVTTLDGRRTTFGRAIEDTYADGIVVLHRGRIAYERYYGVLAPHQPHIAMSVTKSFIGTLATALILDGRIDPKALVPVYVPELSGSGFADATVQQVADMTTAIAYNEVYGDKSSDVWKMRRASGMAPPEPGLPRSLLEFLPTVGKLGTHGEAFTYRTVNTDVLGWIIRRVTGKPMSDLLSEMIWQPMGAEEDAYFTVDSRGMEYCGGGLNTCLRDLARFGEVMRNRGRFNGRQILSEAVVDDIARGADPARFEPAGYATLKGWSYHNQWWVSHNAHGAYMARGIHGQSLYIDPKAEMVIARYAAFPVAGNVANDPLTLPAFAAAAAALMG
ncbi:MAG: serine hydrolase [Hyphomicrobiaceae bacterium]|nr:serine hydrolase [Hyphomicrobiaceae bacterium]